MDGVQNTYADTCLSQVMMRVRIYVTINFEFHEKDIVRLDQ